MSMGPLSRQRQQGLPTPPKGEPIARYATYLEAQRAVDFLSDHQFPVQFVTIVGSGLRMVERVTGRLTYGRVALAGAASGAWFGLFVGLLLTLFGSSYPGGFVLASMAIGAAFGMMFGVISYALTGGRRDFTSTSQIVASEYEVLCMPDHSRAAIELLSQLPGGAGDVRPMAVGPTVPPGSAWGPPPTGRPSPGPGPGQPGGPPAASGWPGAPAGPGGSTAAEPGRPGGPPVAPPTGVVGGAGVPEPAAEQVTGPTYGEMIEKKRLEERQARDREARERVEREARERAEREARGES